MFWSPVFFLDVYGYNASRDANEIEHVCVEQRTAAEKGATLDYKLRLNFNNDFLLDYEITGVLKYTVAHPCGGRPKLSVVHGLMELFDGHSIYRPSRRVKHPFKHIADRHWARFLRRRTLRARARGFKIISSAPLTASQAAEAVRGYWGIENRLHWVLDMVFREDQFRLRKGHGAKTMAVVRHFAIYLVRSAKDKRSIKLRRKVAGWNPNYLAGLLYAAGR